MIAEGKLFSGDLGTAAVTVSCAVSQYIRRWYWLLSLRALTLASTFSLSLSFVLIALAL